MTADSMDQGLHILVAVKGESISESSLRLTESIIRSTGGRITLLLAAPIVKNRTAVDTIKEQYAAIVDPYPVDYCIRRGRFIDQIVKEVVSGSYDLAIIGERPENLLLKHLFTRNADRVIQEVGCPVLIASAQIRPLKRILVCEGGRSTKLLPALTGRLALLTRTAEKVEILHVMSQITASPGIRGWELRANAEELMHQHTPEGERLEHDLGVLHQLGVEASVKVRHGVVIEEILAEAEEGDFDLIMLGMPLVTGWQRYLLDDPVHKIILCSRCPVMVIG